MNINQLSDCILDLEPNTKNYPIKSHLVNGLISIIIRNPFHDIELVKIEEYITKQINIDKNKKLAICELSDEKFISDLKSRLSIFNKFKFEDREYILEDHKIISGVINANNTLSSVNILSLIDEDDKSIYVYIPLTSKETIIGYQNQSMNIPYNGAYLFFNPIKIKLIRTGYERAFILCKFGYRAIKN